MNTLLKQPLAINGGTPVCAKPIYAPAWPPVNEQTAQRLAELYLSRNWSFNGPQEQDFAREFAKYHGAKYGVFMANGTVTLQCALAALGVGAGDEVIMPALTWPATAMAALYLGAVPVFVDVEPTTLCIAPAAFEAAITGRTRAVIPVHIYGGMADTEQILAIAGRHDIHVIEDCAHAQGGMWNGRGVGSWGAIGSFSFQQSKTMSSGEGGICLTNDEHLAELLYRAKHIGYRDGAAQGQSNDSPPPGLLCHNFRGTEFQALILRSQLENLEELIALYNRNADLIQQSLGGVYGVRIQNRGRLATMQSYYSLVFLFDEAPLGDVPLFRIQEALAAEGLSAMQTYGPVYDHSLWNIAPEQYRIHGNCRVADYVGSQRALVLPHTWLGSDDETLDRIGGIIRKVVENADELRPAPESN